MHGHELLKKWNVPLQKRPVRTYNGSHVRFWPEAQGLQFRQVTSVTTTVQEGWVLGVGCWVHNHLFWVKEYSKLPKPEFVFKVFSNKSFGFFLDAEVKVLSGRAVVKYHFAG